MFITWFNRTATVFNPEAHKPIPRHISLTSPVKAQTIVTLHVQRPTISDIIYNNFNDCGHVCRLHNDAYTCYYHQMGGENDT